MNRALAIAALVLSALALGVALFSGGGEPPAPLPLPPPAPEAPALDMTERDAKVAALEWTVSNLVRRVTALEKAMESRPAGEAVATAVTLAERQKLQALREDVDALLTGEALETDRGRERLKDMVRTIQDEVFADRIQQRMAEREARQTDRLQRFVQEARLSATQEADLKRILDAESQARREMFEQMRSGQGGRPDFSKMRAMREQIDEQVRGVLDEEQMRQYDEMREEDRHQRRGGDRGERRQRR